MLKRVYGTVTVLVLGAGSMASVSFAGGGTSGGGFAYDHSRAILEKAIIELKAKVPTLKSKVLDADPKRREILTKVLDNVVSQESEERNRNGDPLMFDYVGGAEHPQIIVLKKYFEAFASHPESLYSLYSIEVQRRLLHEASHLWGFNEVQAKAFERELNAGTGLTKTYEPSLGARMPSITIQPLFMESGKTILKLSYSLSTNGGWFYPVMFLEASEKEPGTFKGATTQSERYSTGNGGVTIGPVVDISCDFSMPAEITFVDEDTVMGKIGYPSFSSGMESDPCKSVAAVAPMRSDLFTAK